MKFIIDANNLAGKLNLLEQKDFDKSLIKIITEYNQGKSNEIILVFDGTDIMGDKYSEGNVTIIRAPKDSFYKSADDKIVELAEQYAGTELTVVTDDIEIKKKIEKIIESTVYKIKLEQASDFAKKIEWVLSRKESKKVGAVYEKSRLSTEEINKINHDLLKSWK